MLISSREKLLQSFIVPDLLLEEYSLVCVLNAMIPFCCFLGLFTLFSIPNNYIFY